jgi:hypothetical protein
MGLSRAFDSGQSNSRRRNTGSVVTIRCVNAVMKWNSLWTNAVALNYNLNLPSKASRLDFREQGAPTQAVRNTQCDIEGAATEEDLMSDGALMDEAPAQTWARSQRNGNWMVGLLVMGFGVLVG